MTSIISIYRRFPTKESCLEHLEKVRWKDEPCCPYCKSEKVSRKKEIEQRNRWQCSLCRKSFSVTVGTIFHNSHVDLQRWFLLISLMFSAKKGLSAMQAARDLEMRRPTVWSMMHRIRAAMVDDGKLTVAKSTVMTALQGSHIPVRTRLATHWMEHRSLRGPNETCRLSLTDQG